MLASEETMPTEDRGDIGDVKPSGWHTVRYNGVVDGNYLYNRCHLLGFQLSGENANERNLITGTRYMNTEGMLPFENRIADYIDATNNHVLLRVTPIFDGENLVASGVQMEALSIEDKGNGICFNVYCYNVQPQIEIDYATGESRLVNDTQETASQESAQQHYVLNTNSKKFHLPDCSSVDDMSPKNKKDYMGTREDLINQGYDPCGRCNPQGDLTCWHGSVRSVDELIMLASRVIRLSFGVQVWPTTGITASRFFVQCFCYLTLAGLLIIRVTVIG